MHDRDPSDTATLAAAARAWHDITRGEFPSVEAHEADIVLEAVLVSLGVLSPLDEICSIFAPDEVTLCVVLPVQALTIGLDGTLGVERL